MSHLAREFIKLGFISTSHLPHLGCRLQHDLEHTWTKKAEYLVEGLKETDIEDRIKSNYTLNSVNQAPLAPIFGVNQPNKVFQTYRYFPRETGHVAFQMFDTDNQLDQFKHVNPWFKLVDFDENTLSVQESSDNKAEIIYEKEEFRTLLQSSKLVHTEDGSYIKQSSMLNQWFETVLLETLYDGKMFHPHLAPIKVSVLSSDSSEHSKLRDVIHSDLTKSGIISECFENSAHSDQLGVPFEVVVGQQTVERNIVVLKDKRTGQEFDVADYKTLSEIFTVYWNSVID